MVSREVAQVFLFNIVSELLGAAYVASIAARSIWLAPLLSGLYFLSFLLTAKLVLRTDSYYLLGVAVLARVLGTTLVVLNS